MSSDFRLAEEEGENLIRPFTLKEIEDALKEMDTNAAPGPDGMPAGPALGQCERCDRIGPLELVGLTSINKAQLITSYR
jgi:hypothetical protein